MKKTKQGVRDWSHIKTSAQNCTVPVDTSGRKYLYMENNELLGSLFSMWHVVGL